MPAEGDSEPRRGLPPKRTGGLLCHCRARSHGGCRDPHVKIKRGITLLRHSLSCPASKPYRPTTFFARQLGPIGGKSQDSHNNSLRSICADLTFHARAYFFCRRLELSRWVGMGQEDDVPRLGLLMVIAIGLCACQSSQKSKAELQAICADPANRQPGQYYFEQCQALYPASTQQLQQWYKQGAAM